MKNLFLFSENAHVQSAKQMVESGMKSLSENETFNHFQGKVQEINENAKVKQTLYTVKYKVTGLLSCGKVESLYTLYKFSL